MLTDAHAHICAPEFDPDRGEVLQRAWAVGVNRVVSVAETLEDCRRNLELAGIHPGILPAAGLYPTILDREKAEEVLTFIRQNRARLVAVGEVGLDFWKVQDESGRELQRWIFGRFIDLAIELDLPLNVHSRAAGRQAVELLLDRRARRVLLHAFDGRAATAMPALEAGYLFSIPPSVVRSPQKQKLARRLPLDSLLLESDSPALGPDPGIRNEPANITVALKAVAELKGTDEDAVRDAVSENARRLFALDLPAGVGDA